jgi:hypothetical protein
MPIQKENRKEMISKQREYLVINMYLERVIRGLPKKDSKQFVKLIHKFYDLPKRPKFIFVYDMFNPKKKGFKHAN